MLEPDLFGATSFRSLEFRPDDEAGMAGVVSAPAEQFHAMPKTANSLVLGALTVVSGNSTLQKHR